MADWSDKAKCRGEPLENFFAPDEQLKKPSDQRHYLPRPPEDVQIMCDSCPVEGECLSYALTRGEHGIWGGTTDVQRKHILKSRWRVACLRCEGANIVKFGPHAICMLCGLSWRVPENVPAA